jgi:hypothetical protein
MSTHPEKEMPARRGRRSLAAAAFAAVLLLSFAGWWFFKPGLHLQVTRCDSDTALLRVDARPETRFSIWFLHSYDRSDFEEHYRVIGEGRIVLSHMTFRSTLNGQGFEMGTYRAKPDGSAELSGIEKEIGEVVFRLGSPDLADHTLKFAGRRLRLLDVAQAGDLLCIQVRSGSQFTRMLNGWRAFLHPQPAGIRQENV